MTKDLIYKIALSCIPGVGNITARTLISHCGGVAEIFRASKKELMDIPGIGEFAANNIVNANADDLAKEEMKHLDNNKHIKVIFFTDDEYPKRLKHFDSAPLLLYMDGDTDLNANRTVAIIGTRSATEYGKMQCEKLVEGLQSYGVQIISGLAYGIDGCAHRAAVDMGINNIAVLGSGIDLIYPAAHDSLARKIKDNGALLSQFPFGTEPNRENFPIRNHVVAGLSDVVIVIQSKKSGGSIITANIANDMNKDVFALPGRTTDIISEGCNDLIKQHKAHLLQSAADVAYIMRWEPQERVEAQLKIFEELDPIQKRIMEGLMGEETVDIDSLHATLEIPLSKLSAELLSLEFKGAVKSLPGKRYMAI